MNLSLWARLVLDIMQLCLPSIRTGHFVHSSSHIPKFSHRPVFDHLNNWKLWNNWNGGAWFTMIHRDAIFPEGVPNFLGNFTWGCQIPCDTSISWPACTNCAQATSRSWLFAWADIHYHEGEPWYHRGISSWEAEKRLKCEWPYVYTTSVERHCSTARYCKIWMVHEALTHW